MPSLIRVLDEKTINQIAAGEVIENPASVVKELVDNALDAKATKIVVEVANSGRTKIRVQDNGSGMSHDDALLCLERHATSKIRSLDDLWTLDTMGFRGEALSSIASVSDITLMTAANSSSSLVPGTEVKVSGGKITSHERVECLGGTNIEVRSLFFNVPARKKFMKSPAKDASDIFKCLAQLALSHPEVAFELIANHKREFSWHQTSQEERIKEVLGHPFFSEMIPLSFKYVHGFITKPHFSKPTRSCQYLFVNKRPVASLAISQVVKEAYGTSLDPSRHPGFVLFIDIESSSLDVNVHPQKKEVRFSLLHELQREILQAVSAALFSRPAVKMEPANFVPSPVCESIHSIPHPSPFTMTLNVMEAPKEQIVVLAVLGDYIIVERDGLYVISAKHARLALAAQPRQKVRPEIQRLLVPVFIEVASHEALELKAQMSKLEEAGIEIREFGNSSFLVEGIPSYLEASSIEDVIRSLLDEGIEGKDIAPLLAKLAGRQTASRPLSKESAAFLVKKLFECPDPWKGPSGELVATLLTKDDLDKLFR